MKKCKDCGTEALNEKQKICFECDRPFRRPLFEPKQGTIAMRSNKFSELTAYCEVIDNSIEADASVVRMKMDHDGRHIMAMAFGDDGCGMDHDTLEGCLSIGGSTRAGDQSESGLGRFGVGMKFAAWNQCKRCSVWSKNKGGSWMYTYADIDEIERGEMEDLPEPISQDPPPQYSNLVGKDQGTLVLWEKYDGLKMSLSQLQKEIPIYLGRTYRYFMWNEGSEGEPIPGRTKPLRIYFDGEELHTLDPIYSNIEKNRFPDDPQSKVYDTITIPWPVDVHNIKNSDPPEESDVRIRFSLLPEEWRPAIGAGNVTSVCGPRGIAKESNGFSILRNYREVFFGEIDGRVWKGTPPKGWSRFDDIDRWWGCEILFDAWLDNAFDVSNIKGAVPTRELRETIKLSILPSRKTANEEVQRVWDLEKDRKRRRKQKKEEEELERRRHAEAERIAATTPGPVPQAGKDRGLDEALDEYFDKRKSEYSDAEEAAKKRKIFEAQPYSIEDTNFPGSKFFDTSHFDGKAILEYNLGHVFFERIYELLQLLADPDDEESTPDQVVEEMKVMIDLLIISYARAEGNFADGQLLKSEQYRDTMRNYWGQFLESYIHHKEAEEG